MPAILKPGRGPGVKDGPILAPVPLIQHPPESLPCYAVKLDDTCGWTAVTRAKRLPGGRLEYVRVMVPGRWETGAIAEPGEWCRCDGWNWSKQ